MTIHVTETYNVSPKLVERIMREVGVNDSKIYEVIRQLKEVIDRDKLRKVVKRDISTISCKDCVSGFADGAGCTSSVTFDDGVLSEGGR